MKTEIKNLLDKQHGHLREFIRIVLSGEPDKSSEEVKAMFLLGLKQIIDPKPVGWEGTGFTEEAFHGFWHFAWEEARRMA